MTKVDEPCRQHFTPYKSKYTQYVASCPKFTASLFYSDPSGEDKDRQRFARRLLKLIRAGDVPFKRVLVNEHVLDEAATRLKKKDSSDVAFGCINTVLESEVFELRPLPSDIFTSACKTFCSFDDHGGALPILARRSLLKAPILVTLQPGMSTTRRSIN